MKEKEDMKSPLPAGVAHSYYKDVYLEVGDHETYGEGACAMEWVDYLDRKRKGEHVLQETLLTDSPACVCPAIVNFVRRWNDDLDDIDRNRLLPQLLPLCLDTNTGTEDQDRRAWMVADWLIRVCTPAWLDVSGMFYHASALRSLSEIDQVSVVEAHTVLGTIKVTWSAVESRSREERRVSICVARQSAAGAAAAAATKVMGGCTAMAAVWNVARVAAEYAALCRVPLRPTIELLQKSAVDLLRRMCEVGAKSD